MNNILAWINCYGAWEPDTGHPLGMIGYDRYLEGVVESLALLGERISAVWLSGGMICNGKTECETVEPELVRRFKQRGLEVAISTDVESITSITIVRKFLSVWSIRYTNCHPLLFCDAVRYRTNSYVLEELAKQMSLTLEPREVIVPIERLDIHPSSTALFQEKKIRFMRENGIDEIERREIDLRRLGRNDVDKLI